MCRIFICLIIVVLPLSPAPNGLLVNRNFLLLGLTNQQQFDHFTLLLVPFHQLFVDASTCSSLGVRRRISMAGHARCHGASWQDWTQSCSARRSSIELFGKGDLMQNGVGCQRQTVGYGRLFPFRLLLLCFQCFARGLRRRGQRLLHFLLILINVIEGSVWRGNKAIVWCHCWWIMASVLVFSTDCVAIACTPVRTGRGNNMTQSR